MKAEYAAYLSYIALAFYVAAMLVRGTIFLRLLLLAGTVAYVGYYSFVSSEPLWDAIFASIAIGVANFYMLIRLMLERSVYGLNAQSLEIYNQFTTFNPGQFKRVIKLATWHKATSDIQVCTIGQAPKQLYFIIAGDVVLERDGKQIQMQGGQFVGEISFMRGKTATANADVTLKAGTDFVAWDRTKLSSLMAKSDAISNAFGALFNRELSNKLDGSWPEQATK